MLIDQVLWHSPNGLFWLDSFNPWIDPTTVCIPFNFVGPSHFCSFLFDPPCSPPHWSWIFMPVGPRRWSSTDSVGVSRSLGVMIASYIHLALLFVLRGRVTLLTLHQTLCSSFAPYIGHLWWLVKLFLCRFISISDQPFVRSCNQYNFFGSTYSTRLFCWWELPSIRIFKNWSQSLLIWSQSPHCST